MQIKLAILEQDENYLKRMAAALSSRYAQELQLYSFTEAKEALTALKEKKIQVFLCSEECGIDLQAVPGTCSFAWLVESAGVDKLNGQRAVCKFQRVEQLYKQVLNLFSEQAPEFSGGGSGNAAMKVIAFASPAGGVGNSSLAAAFAISAAKAGKRVLFLNESVYGSADDFFFSDGQFDFSEAIYAVKSSRTNRSIKLQSTVKQDASGVYFYSSVKIALDMMEMTPEDHTVLLQELQKLGCYDIVVLDLDFPRCRQDFQKLYGCRWVVITSDSTEQVQNKVDKALTAIRVLDENAERALQPRVWLAWNRTSEEKKAQGECSTLGSFPQYQNVPPAQMARQLALSPLFQKLM